MIDQINRYSIIDLLSRAKIVCDFARDNYQLKKYDVVMGPLENLCEEIEILISKVKEMEG